MVARPSRSKKRKRVTVVCRGKRERGCAACPLWSEKGLCWTGLDQDQPSRLVNLALPRDWRLELRRQICRQQISIFQLGFAWRLVLLYWYLTLIFLSLLLSHSLNKVPFSFDFKYLRLEALLFQKFSHSQTSFFI